jgi:CDP-glucose 4,6-dehydratase
MSTDRNFWSGRRVLVTGHTGFKGTWLCHWLTELGAEVTGVGLEPAAAPSLFAATGLGQRVDSRVADVRDRQGLAAVLAGCRPEVVLHLAAQPLVLASLEAPLATFETNILGTANLLEAARRQRDLRAIVVVTSDKCYLRPERRCSEDDPLGGHDPYSASKACAEIVAGAYRACCFPPGSGVGLATARAGNVIGGGDFSPGRLLPDLVRAFARGEPAPLRHPGAIRPWQHVLDALGGYLLLAERLFEDPAAHASAWNFGPEGEATWTAAAVADLAAARFGAGTWRLADGAAAIEVPTLLLSSDKARTRLGWRPKLGTADAVEWTVDGYLALLREGATAGWLTRQIAAFADRQAAAPPAPLRLVEPLDAVA